MIRAIYELSLKARVALLSLGMLLLAVGTLTWQFTSHTRDELERALARHQLSEVNHMADRIDALVRQHLAAATRGKHKPISLNDPVLLTEIDQVRDHTTSRFLIVSPAEKLYTSSSDPGLTPQPLPAPGKDPMLDRLLQKQQETAWISQDSDGIGLLGSSRSLASNGWIVIGLMTTDETHARITHIRNEAIQAAFLVSLAAGVLFWLFLRHEFSFLSRSGELIEQLSSSRKAALHGIPLSGSPEIRQLQSSFNRLQEHIAQDEKMLRQEMTLYQSMFTNNTSIKLLINPKDGSIVDANPAAADYYGWPIAMLRKMHITDINILPPEEVRHEMELALTEKRHFFRFKHRLASGEIRDVEVHSGHVDYYGHSLLYSIINDVTEREQALQREKLRSEMLEMLARGNDLTRILGAITREIEKELPLMLCSVMLLDREGKHLSTAVAPSLPTFFCKAMEEFEVSEDGYLCAQAAASGERVLIHDIRNNPLCSGCKEVMAQAELAACWFEPVFSSRQKVLGTLAMYQRQVLAPVQGQVRLIEEMARIIGIAIERKQIEDELQLASTVFQASPEAIVITDSNNRIVAVNPAFTQITQFQPHEAIGHDPKLLSSGKQGKEFYKHMWSALVVSGRWQGEIINRRKNGETYAEWLNINTVRDENGEVRHRIAIFSDITDKKRSEEIIWRQANYDSLTGLPNRRLFHDRLIQEMKREDREKGALSLMFIDLDHFKEVNDTLGHESGDNLLIQASRRVAGCIRESDTLARLGGDEFTIILPGLSDAKRLGALADNIIHALAKPFLIGDITTYVSASIGITIYPQDADNLSALLKHADQAMYVAKNKGRNQYSYFTRSLQEAAQTRLQLSTDLRHALNDGQFEIHYQPIVDLSTGLPTKAEALLRWHHPRLGFISPTLFIPLAEEIGLITEIGDWVFRQAALKAKQWCSSSNPVLSTMQISVNKSPRQFIAGENNLGLLDWLKALDIPPSCIVVEITEGLLMDDRAEVQQKLLAFRDAGIQVSLDDFGTGYSAMSYLQRFDIDYLKIDQSFVRNMVSNPGDHAIAEAIIVMAHKLGMKVVAEGVETVEQRDMLVKAGCDYGQGYLYARPMTAEAFDQFLAQALATA